ncbi:hypothetical protein BDZ94DRAFT_1244266 [Collybia nuda]|uniref:Uncharacterized protein n=1 Tax=Collybia nuda TaxID=64659 RepID=A0A9P5YG72_9AGAR|nr:hypothetical protein BDZ94DRAFT_1244266 [Collybia nuda]
MGTPTPGHKISCLIPSATTAQILESFVSSVPTNVTRKTIPPLILINTLSSLDTSPSASNQEMKICRNENIPPTNIAPIPKSLM